MWCMIWWSGQGNWYRQERKVNSMAIKSKKWKPISIVYQTNNYLRTPNCYHKILSSCNSIRSSHVKSVSRAASCQNLWVCRHWGDFVTGRRPARRAECDWVSWAALELKQLTSRRSHVMWARGVPLTIPLLPTFRAILTILRHNHSHFYIRLVYTSYCSREVNCTRMQMIVLHLSVLLGF